MTTVVVCTNFRCVKLILPNSATFCHFTKLCHFAGRYRPKTTLPPTLRVGVWVVVDADECQQKKTYLITQVACVDVQRDGVHADMDESKGEEKELTDLRDLLTGASGGRGMQMCCVRCVVRSE